MSSLDWLLSILYLLISICRALGTALEWPEAKKKAGQVREWGIEVCSRIRYVSATSGLRLLTCGSISNYLPIGAEQEVKNAMLSFGVTRYVALAAQCSLDLVANLLA